MQTVLSTVILLFLLGFQINGVAGEPYRLSDVILYGHDDPCGHLDSGWKERYATTYPQSIATEYFQRSTCNNDLQLVHTLVKERKNTHQCNFDDSTLVVHVRIGDVIDSQPYSAQEFLSRWRRWWNPDTNKETWAYYVAPYEYFESALRSLLQEKRVLTRVAIVGGIHVGNNHSKSLEYVELIKKFFQENFPAAKVETRIAIDPATNWNAADRDLILLSHARLLIQAQGGFGALAAHVARQEGATILQGDLPWDE